MLKNIAFLKCFWTYVVQFWFSISDRICNERAFHVSGFAIIYNTHISGHGKREKIQQQ